MQANDLLNILPPFMGKEVVITPKQSVNDIVNEVLAAHKEFAPHYDTIAKEFAGGNVPKKLFDFCKNNIKYQVEAEEYQTTVSPAGILALAKGDCKHFALFTAGVLDALNQAGYGPYDWCYRFVGYDKKGKAKIEHVYVVVKENGKEIWIDPAPIFLAGGEQLRRNFNDRLAVPTYISDYKPETMSLSRLSGIEFQSYSESQRRQPVKDDKDCCGSVGDVVEDTLLALNRDLADDGRLNKSYPPGIHRTWQGPVGVYYKVGGVEITLPVGGKLPTDLVVEYPDYWHGAKIPQDLPRPMVVGIRLVLLPKLGTWDVVKDNNNFWLVFLVQAMRALVRAYSQYPDWNDGLSESFENSGTLANTILYDLDRADIVDYITRKPITLPLLAEVPAGVRYLVNGIDLVWPVNRGNRTVGENEAEQPPNFPDGLQVVYPTTFAGFPVPANLPKILAKEHLLKLDQLTITVEEFSAHGYVWYSFLVSVIAPLINGYARMPYVGSGGQLSERVWGDVTGQYPVGNYLDEPNKQSWLGNFVEQVGTTVHEITMFSLMFVNAPARLCFMGLIRINAFNMAYNLFWTYQQTDKRNELEKRWRDIGGNVGDLKSAIILGCKNNPVFGGGVKQWIEDAVQDGILENGYVRPPGDEGTSDADDPSIPGNGTTTMIAQEPADSGPYVRPTEIVTLDAGDLSVNGIGELYLPGEGCWIGVVGADDVVYYLALAASVIAALAKFLKGIGGEKTDKIVDDVVNGVDVLLAAAGEDPIGTGGITQVPVKITDPVTGKEYTIQPVQQLNNPPGIGTWIKDNPLTSLGIAAGVWWLYEMSNNHKNKRA